MLESTSNTSGSTNPFRILSLDGGGAKGFYTLGILKELEALVKPPLGKKFDLIYGTSTGSIIAALLSLGNSVDDIHRMYKDFVPQIMCRFTKRGKSAALKTLTDGVFGDRKFDAFLTNIGIVATRWEMEKPMIFKGNIDQAHGRKPTFVPGFGCRISDAVQASCSAYPVFNYKIIETNLQERIKVIDGGFCANNPALYALADAIVAFKQERSNIRLISLGVGVYPEPTKICLAKILKMLPSVKLLIKTLNINTTSMEQLRAVLYKDVPTVRINDTFERPEMATDLMELDLDKLDQLYQRGRESYGKMEQVVSEFMISSTQRT